ncbi:hypothetical protein [Chitinophaga sp. XS-30]|uniref:hypothetical protein n=1 Tax=Chitinophaga sp. XS-30 TaxID=2604421 RepID=UPI0011DCD157|nr:hypothetical protein [Chitinophaga sp. XS-30]QEH40498.1 hypothetical protein FW415_06275 [Chitinophaga sp. XS-30]
MKHYFNTNKVLTLTAVAISSITIFFACKKEDKEGADEQQDVQVMGVAQKEAEINAIYEDALEVTLETSASDNGLDGSSRKAPTGTEPQARFCPSMEISYLPADLETWPKTIRIDFLTGCTDQFNRTRKGAILVSLNKPIFLQGAEAIITFEDYYVNDIKVEGTQTVQSLFPGYAYNVSAGKLTFPGGKVMEYSGSRTITLKEGAETPLVLMDDVYELSGNATVKDSLVTAQVVTTEKLIRKLNCAYIDKGILTITANGQVATLDYGNGECDNKAMLTLKDKSKEITLPR